MSITETVRTARIKRWQNLKSAWVTKLDEADNENDRNVASAMIAEAEGMITRLESHDKKAQEEDIYDPDKVAAITKKIKGNPKKRGTDTKMEEEERKSTLGP